MLSIETETLERDVGRQITQLPLALAFDPAAAFSRHGWFPR
jgi:hypothetical protein